MSTADTSEYVAALLQHRLAVLIVAAALAATAGVFLFARPQYRPPHCDGCKQLHFSAPRPYHGWQWRDATPGFHFGEHHNEWRVDSRVAPNDIPAGAGVLKALTDRPRRTEVFWHDGRCVGVTFADGARRRLCNLKTPFVFLAHAEPQFQPGLWNMFIIGLARADVTKITELDRAGTYVDMTSGTRVVKPMSPQPLFDARTPPWWGAWEGGSGQPVPWDVTLKVYGKQDRLLATAHVTFTSPGERLYCASALRGVCGMSAQRRS